jgi:hypothetical protein
VHPSTALGDVPPPIAFIHEVSVSVGDASQPCKRRVSRETLHS